MDFEQIIILIWIPIIWSIVEIVIQLWVKLVNKKFQWLIIGKDQTPKLPNNGLKKFFSHGYDPVLGWIRKPNTSHSVFGSSAFSNMPKTSQNNSAIFFWLGVRH